jgi:hypoxanthine phosphoribosyltransferase
MYILSFNRLNVQLQGATMLHSKYNFLFLSLTLLTMNTYTVNKQSVNAHIIENMCQDLYQKMNNDSYTPDLIIGISRGGLVPLGYLAGEKMFNIRNTLSVAVKSYEGDQHGEISLLHPIHFEDLKQYKNILVVDDIVDSGQTVRFVLDTLKTNLPNASIKTAVLYYKPKVSELKPDYYMQETEDWIIFPWEQN